MDEEQSGMLTIPRLLMEHIEATAKEEEVSVHAAFVAYLEAGKDMADSPLGRYGIRATAQSWQHYHDTGGGGTSTPVKAPIPFEDDERATKISIHYTDYEDEEKTTTIYRYECLALVEDAPAPGGVVSFSEESPEHARRELESLLVFLGVVR